MISRLDKRRLKILLLSVEPLPYLSRASPLPSPPSAKIAAIFGVSIALISLFQLSPFPTLFIFIAHTVSRLGFPFLLAKLPFLHAACNHSIPEQCSPFFRAAPFARMEVNN